MKMKLFSTLIKPIDIINLITNTPAVPILKINTEIKSMHKSIIGSIKSPLIDSI